MEFFPGFLEAVFLTLEFGNMLKKWGKGNAQFPPKL